MNALTQHQVENNATSRDRWNRFRAHRDKLTSLLSSAPPSSRLCVLGAGNCNDLDLNALLNFYREIHLVDLDTNALSHGVEQQGLGRSPSVQFHGGIDLTGVIEVMDAWTPRSAITDEDLAACEARPVARVRPAMPAAFDVVVSCCLLSQLIDCVVRTAGEQHPRFLAAIQAVRAGHLRLLVDLVAPGGVGYLITDFVSSDTVAGLASTPEEALPAVASQLLQDRNFFHGVNPVALASAFRADAFITSQVVALQGISPWRWDIGPRIYLIYALKFRKGSSGVVGP